MEDEERFLRKTVVRLRGMMSFALAPEVRVMLREVVTDFEDRLDELDRSRRLKKRE